MLQFIQHMFDSGRIEILHLNTRGNRLKYIFFNINADASQHNLLLTVAAGRGWTLGSLFSGITQRLLKYDLL